MANNANRVIKVDELKASEAGKGIARLDPALMDVLGLRMGDIALIIGDKKTAVKVQPGDELDRNLGIIRLDGSTRGNANVSIGDKVEVKKAEAKPAEKINFAPVGELRLQGGEEYLSQALVGRAFTKGDVLSMNIMGNRIDLVVTSYTPTGDATVMMEGTKVKISAKPVQKEGLDVPKVFYDDLGGLGDAVRQVREMIELPLKHPELFKRLGVEAPKGVLLHGPPGTGKTMLAKAVAGETSSNFITIGGPEIVSKFYGESEGKLREIFKDAEENAPSIIFIDEIDSIAPKREDSQGEEERRIVAQLLSLMDGLNARGRVVVIGATNRPNSIDEALRRPGRFDREIEIGVPDRKGRLEILEIHTRGMPIDSDVDLALIADKTHGYVGADLAALCREAAMAALRRVLPDVESKDDTIPAEVLNRLNVTAADFIEAMRGLQPSAMREVLIEKPNVKWDDIGALEDAKQQLREAVEWPLKYSKVFSHMNAKPPKGILLYGPPGTGKTLLAKAVATESEANFISVKGPEFLNKYIGESEKAVRDTFHKARQASPCVVFIDEIDSIAPKRGGGDGDGHATERVVSQMLTEMDGLEPMNNVVVIAATNRPDIIDPALMRPGRLDKAILVNLPDEKSRKSILGIHMKGKPVEDDVDLDVIAKETDGCSGADLSAICNEAVMTAVRRLVSKGDVTDADIDGCKVSMADLRGAVDKFGPNAKKTLDEYGSGIY